MFVEDYSLGIKREKELLEKMTLKRTEIKAYGSLLKDEEKVIKKLSDKYK